MGERSGDSISESEVRVACEHILSSHAFAKAGRMGRLLRFLIEQAIHGDVRNTTEYAIGLEVFDRKPSSYSPGEDPTVRVQVGRLRQRLETYHGEHGFPCGLEVRIPLGSYMPVITRRPVRCAPVAILNLPVMHQGTLELQPIRFIAGSALGKVFTRGLNEELVNQMVEAFGTVVMGAAGEGGAASSGAPLPRVVVSSIRVDPDRIRASVRLLETPQMRVTWARQFDRAPGFSIQEQEELASTICRALKQHLHE